MKSINYARRIQRSILPRTQQMQEQLSGLFVLYNPKDIVSGDFYWYSQKNEHIFIEVADCTGHGVPSAFITLINNFSKTSYCRQKYPEYK